MIFLPTVVESSSRDYVMMKETTMILRDGKATLHGASRVQSKE